MNLLRKLLRLKLMDQVNSFKKELQKKINSLLGEYTIVDDGVKQMRSLSWKRNNTTIDIPLINSRSQTNDNSY